MFTQPTVLILGAGASWHYGYPTGEDLVEMIVTKLEDWQGAIDSKEQRFSFDRDFYLNYLAISKDFQSLPQELTEYIKKLNILRQAIKPAAELLKSIDPINIDVFLQQNKQYEPIIKIAISTLLFECEGKLPKQPIGQPIITNTNWRKKNNWYRFLWHALTAGVKIDDNDIVNTETLEESIANLTIVSFNYDRSLENFLSQSLNGTQSFKERAKDLMELLEKNIHHVYGQFYPITGEIAYGKYGISSSGDKIKLMQAAALAAENIHIINGEKHTSLFDQMADWRIKVERAGRIVILGYGFDRENNKICGLDDVIYYNWHADEPHEEEIFCKYTGQYLGRTVAYTNFNNSMRIERKIELTDLVKTKSTENVYNALSRDFDLEHDYARYR